MDGSGASASPHVLVVDDDKRLCTLLARFLGAQGFRVTTAASSDEARTRLRSFAFDLIVLDVMLPGESGLELTQSLRAESAVPILLLTARGDPEDRIEGLERGADDYLAKPFEPRELVARIRSVLRRVRQQPTPSQPLRFGDVRFDAERALLLRGSNPLRLSTAEAKMLQRLALSGGEPVSREELSAISGAGGNLRSVDVQIARLRRKIEPDPRLPRYLQTVRGQGYALRPD